MKQSVHPSVTLHERPAPATSRPAAAPAPRDHAKLAARGFSAFVGDVAAVRDLTLDIPARRITALVGPSGSGKSVFLRCLNRMHELTPGARVRGSLELDGRDLHGPDVDPVQIRRRVGMVFEKAAVFPFLSIRENLLAGHRLAGVRVKDPDALVERVLRQAALWGEVANRLSAPGSALSSGQQQRLAIARALALDPEVLLLDAPCAGLDPAATARIEALLSSLRARITVVLSTHDLQQAARVSDRTAFFLDGRLVEAGPTARFFTNPTDPRAEAYLTGRFGDLGAHRG